MKKVNNDAARALPTPKEGRDYKSELLKDDRQFRELRFRFDDKPLHYKSPSIRQRAEINRLAGITPEGVQPGAEYKLIMLTVIHTVYMDGKLLFEATDLDTMLDLPESSPVVQLAAEVATIIAEENSTLAAAKEGFKKN